MGLLTDGQTVLRSRNSGETWTDPVGVSGEQFVADGLGGVVHFRPYGGELHRLEGGAFVQVRVAGAERPGWVRQAGGVAMARDSAWPQRWYRTTDWRTFEPMPETLKDATRLVRDRVDAFHPITATTWLAQAAGDQFLITRDGGRTWSDPVEANTRVEAVYPFTEEAIWAVGGQTLNRAGTF
ncbi:MAG: hypothetical protein VKS61_14155 [Candidatus Sericytochromatia bacterium]|nr:hypothetical protein [Candidatus Sericytochromatia bacterium]